MLIVVCSLCFLPFLCIKGKAQRPQYACWCIYFCTFFLLYTQLHSHAENAMRSHFPRALTVMDTDTSSPVIWSLSFQSHSISCNPLDGLLPLWIDLPSGEMDEVFATRRHHPDHDQSSVLLVQAPMRETDRSFSIDDPQAHQHRPARGGSLGSLCVHSIGLLTFPVFKFNAIEMSREEDGKRCW